MIFRIHLRLGNLTAELEAAKEEIDYLETILSRHKKEPSNEGLILDEYPREEVDDDHTDNEDHELGLDEEPVDGIMELEQTDDLLVLTKPQIQR